MMRGYLTQKFIQQIYGYILVDTHFSSTIQTCINKWIIFNKINIFDFRKTKFLPSDFDKRIDF